MRAWKINNPIKATDGNDKTWQFGPKRHPVRRLSATHRTVAGKKWSICGNGNSGLRWNGFISPYLLGCCHQQNGIGPSWSHHGHGDINIQPVSSGAAEKNIFLPKPEPPTHNQTHRSYRSVRVPRHLTDGSCSVSGFWITAARYAPTIHPPEPAGPLVSVNHASCACDQRSWGHSQVKCVCVCVGGVDNLIDQPG